MTRGEILSFVLLEIKCVCKALKYMPNFKREDSLEYHHLIYNRAKLHTLATKMYK